MNANSALAHQRHLTRRGFTLVEILTVIVIIGILMGLLIPAATAAYRNAKETAIRTEIGVIEQSLESYKLQHGDYPPDFSDWGAVDRHFRKAFPNINDNELRILAQFTHMNSMHQLCSAATGVSDPRTSSAFDHYPHAIDRAEALLFCLGGFSRDKERPFTGAGGPLVLITGAADPYTSTPANDDYAKYQYNAERDEGFLPVKPEQLSMTLFVANTGPLAAGYGMSAPYVYSTDEGDTNTNSLGFTLFNDPFPTYRPKNSELPIVYFASRTYNSAWGINYSSAPAWASASTVHHSQNVYLPPGSIDATGVARPYASNVVDTTPPATIQGFSVQPGGTVLKFAADGKFQLISAGLDDNYGGIISQDIGDHMMAPAATGISVYPSGEAYCPLLDFTSTSYGTFTTITAVNKFNDDQVLQRNYAASAVYRANPQLDNITNFTTRTIESDLP